MRIQATCPKQPERHIEEASVVPLAVVRLHDAHLETLDGRTMVLERGLEQAKTECQFSIFAGTMYDLS